MNQKRAINECLRLEKARRNLPWIEDTALVVSLELMGVPRTLITIGTVRVAG